jgi:exodeoxyribonuclease-3
MLKVATVNLNGLRASIRKGFLNWLDNYDADIVCLQEIRVAEKDLPRAELNNSKYKFFFSHAKKPGYSGVGFFYKKEPQTINKIIKHKVFDDESRFIQFDYDAISIISLYAPSGSSSEKRLILKFEFMDFFIDILKKLVKFDKKIIICGDFNVAHKKIDLKNWKTNQKNSGFLPEEREWFDNILKMGFLDVFREINIDSGHYTWWSNRANAYTNNVGWRIDYQLATKNLRNKILSSKIIKEPRFSDHAILEANYDLDF